MRRNGVCFQFTDVNAPFTIVFHGLNEFHDMTKLKRSEKTHTHIQTQTYTVSEEKAATPVLSLYI